MEISISASMREQCFGERHLFRIGVDSTAGIRLRKRPQEPPIATVSGQSNQAEVSKPPASKIVTLKDQLDVGSAAFPRLLLRQTLLQGRN
jgi:hypothetical protein